MVSEGTPGPYLWQIASTKFLVSHTSHIIWNLKLFSLLWSIWLHILWYYYWMMKYMKCIHCNICICTLPIDMHLKNHSQIGAVSTSTTTHIDEHYGCSPHSLSLGCVGRSEVMHCVASFALHFEVYLYFYEAIDVSITMWFKFDA